MQFTIERGALLKALGHVQNVVERRNTIPILSNVLLSAERGQVSFSATDLDMEIVDTAEAIVSVPGQITAPAHTLYEIVRKLPDGADVELKFAAGDDPRLSVSAGRSRFALPVLPAGDFPIMSSDHEPGFDFFCRRRFSRFRRKDEYGLKRGWLFPFEAKNRGVYTRLRGQGFNPRLRVVHALGWHVLW